MRLRSLIPSLTFAICLLRGTTTLAVSQEEQRPIGVIGSDSASEPVPTKITILEWPDVDDAYRLLVKSLDNPELALRAQEFDFHNPSRDLPLSDWGSRFAAEQRNAWRDAPIVLDHENMAAAVSELALSKENEDSILLGARLEETHSRAAHLYDTPRGGSPKSRHWHRDCPTVSVLQHRGH